MFHETQFWTFLSAPRTGASVAGVAAKARALEAGPTPTELGGVNASTGSTPSTSAGHCRNDALLVRGFGGSPTCRHHLLTAGLRQRCGILPVRIRAHASRLGAGGQEATDAMRNGCWTQARHGWIGGRVEGALESGSVAGLAAARLEDGLPFTH